MPDIDKLYEILRGIVQPPAGEMRELELLNPEILGLAGAGGAATTKKTPRKKKGTKASKKKGKKVAKKKGTRKKGSTPRATAATPTVGSTTVGAQRVPMTVGDLNAPQGSSGPRRMLPGDVQQPTPQPTRAQQLRTRLEPHNPAAPGLSGGQRAWRTAKGGGKLSLLLGLGSLAGSYFDDDEEASVPTEDLDAASIREAAELLGLPPDTLQNIGRSGIQSLLRDSYTSREPNITNPMGDWETDHAGLLESLTPESYTDEAIEALLAADDSRKEALAQQQKSKPQAPEFDKSETMRAFLGGMAAAVAGIQPGEGGYNIAQIFAAAGGGGHAALEEQDRYQEGEMSEYQSELSDFYQNVATFQATMAADKARNDLALVKVMQDQATDETNRTFELMRLTKPQVIQDPNTGDVLLRNPVTGTQEYIPSLSAQSAIAAGRLPKSPTSFTLPNGKLYEYDANSYASVMGAAVRQAHEGMWGDLNEALERQSLPRAKELFKQANNLDEAAFNVVLGSPDGKWAAHWELEKQKALTRVIVEHFNNGTPVAQVMTNRMGNIAGASRADAMLNPGLPGVTP